MPAVLVAKMMASQQNRTVDSKSGQTKGYFIYSVRMTNIDYYRCDSLVPEKQSAKEINYNVNLSERDKIVAGKYLALCDSGANGVIIRMGLLILYFNSNNKSVSIGIAGDH